MPKIFSAKGFGEEIGMPHLEVIRRIRRGDIKAEKLDWNWIIQESELDVVRNSNWYKKYTERHPQGSGVVAPATS